MLDRGTTIIPMLITAGLVMTTGAPVLASEVSRADIGFSKVLAGEEMTITLPGGVPLVLVRIPAGTFLMGSPPEERGNVFENENQHQVTLTQDYYLGKTEVTQEQWRAITGESIETVCATSGNVPDPLEGVGDDYPMYCTNWDRIAGPGGFLEMLNEHLGSTQFRLPTEAEWERACRADTTTRFWHGDVLECGDDCEACSAHEPSMWWCGDDSASGPKPVGQKQQNPFGLHDMHGNVFEVVNDRYADDYGNPSGGNVTDPTGPATTGDVVFKGGGWSGEAWFGRSAIRLGTAHGNQGQSDALGFRIATTAAPAGTLDKRYFFPAAAKSAGAEGSFFFTDATVNNAGSDAATYAFLWLPRGSDNSEPLQSEEFTLEAGRSVVYSDVLGALFDFEDGASGALAVVSDSSDLLLLSRTYNQVSGGGGTFGQAIPGYAMDDLIMAGTKKRLIFFVENDLFRTNLGFMNGTGTTIRIQWERFTPDGVSVDTGSTNLPAWGSKQFNTVFSGEAPINGGYIDVWTSTEGGAFAAYGSMLDNVTSDPTTILPQ
jgi:formylglycine-generating enzyme required for sulfatase activity